MIASKVKLIRYFLKVSTVKANCCKKLLDGFDPPASVKLLHSAHDHV